MAFRYLTTGADMPALTANKIQGYSNKICEVAWADEKAVDAFKEAIAAVDSAAAEAPLTRDSVKTQSFTDAVKLALGVESRANPGAG